MSQKGVSRSHEVTPQKAANVYILSGDEGIGFVSDETPARFSIIIGTDTFYFYEPVFDARAVPGTILTATRREKVYEFLRVSNGESPKWRITSIRDKNSFHTDHGERTANDLFGKILKQNQDNTYYVPSYKGLPFTAQKSNVEKKVLEFLANLKNVETEEALRELVWEFKYGSTVSEWITRLSEGEDALPGSPPQIDTVGTIIEIDDKNISFRGNDGHFYLFTLNEKGCGYTFDLIEAKRGHWFYTFNRIENSDKWRIISKVRED